MNTDYYKYMLAVAEYGSIRQAATELYMKQQNLSKIVRDVEQYYGITIFERSSKGVTATPDGKIFLQEARKLLEIVQRMESPDLYPSNKRFSQIVDNLNIYASSVMGSTNIVQVINRFKVLFPNVSINFFTHNKDKMFHAIRNDEKSVGLLATVKDLTEISIPDDFIAKPHLHVPIVAATTMDNEEAKNLTSISMHELLNKNLILLSQEQITDTFTYELLCQYGTPNVQHTVENASIFLDLIRQNQGWTVCIEQQAIHNHLRAVPFQENCTVHSLILYKKILEEDIIVKNLIKLLSDIHYS